MTTPSEYAQKPHTAPCPGILGISSDDFDAKGTAHSHQTGSEERNTRARNQGSSAFQRGAAQAQERVVRLLSASPAVIYSFKATGDFAPTFVSDNIIDVFGYAPATNTWKMRPSGATGYIPTPGRKGNIHILPEWSALERGVSLSPQNRSNCWVNDDQHLIRGLDGKLEIGALLERHPRARDGGRGASCSACSAVTVA